MPHLSLYRKYRSQSFSELIGQDHVVKALKNAIGANKVAHAYLFTGPRGTGKTSTARLLAKCLCAEGGPNPDPDPSSEMSVMIAEGACPDVVEIDAASESGVNDVRQAIVEAVEYKPMMAPYKVFIVDEVHDLSGKAFDALLKTIEEPPPHVVFVLATTEYHKVPPTIRSRCQQFEFHRASVGDIVKQLESVLIKEGATAEPGALTLLAKLSDGGFRDALTLLEQMLTTTGLTLTAEAVREQLGLVDEQLVDDVLKSIATGNVSELLQKLSEVGRLGRDSRSLLESLLHRLADLARSAYGVDRVDERDQARVLADNATAAEIGADKIIRLRGALAASLKDIREVTIPRIWLESVLCDIAVSGLERNLSPKSAPKDAVRVPGKNSMVLEDGPPSRASTKQEDRPTGQSPRERPKPTEELVSNPSPKVSERRVPPERPAEEKVASAEGAPVQKSKTDGVSQSEIWKDFVKTIQAPAHVRRLSRSSFVSEADGVWKVDVGAMVFASWYEEDHRRRRYLEAELGTKVGKDVRVEFVAESLPKDNGATAEETVELPLEGESLYERAKVVFSEPPHETS